jgi:hypothetical protein
MDLLNVGTPNNDYDGINALSTDNEKLDVVFKVLAKGSMNYVEYHKLHIPYERESLFNAKVKATGLVEVIQDRNAYNPMFKLNDAGHLIFEKYNSYSEYLRSTMSEIDLMNLILTQLNTKNVGECHQIDELIKATNLDSNTLEVICRKIDKLGDCSYHIHCTNITNAGKYRAQHGGYKKEEKPTGNTNILQIGVNQGIANQDSALSERAINKSMNNAPIPKEIKQNPIIAILKKYWWGFLIPIVIGIILLAIEYKWFNKPH